MAKWRGVPFLEIFWVRHIRSQKMPSQKEGVSCTKTSWLFSGFVKKKKKVPIKQKIIQIKFKSGLLIYNYMYRCR